MINMSKIVHYNMDNIDHEGANINIIYGERSNGKSYQLKHKKGVVQYIKGGDRYISSYLHKDDIIKKSIASGSRFILMRRLREELTPAFIEQYFADIDISELTDGEYNCITTYRKQIFLGYYDHEERKVKRGEKIGYAAALSTEQNYAGGSYLDVSDIIFEEFMSRGSYLPDESNKLMNFYSTVDRKRGYVKLWLVGNTITRVCPYLYDWGLNEVMKKMKQGDLKSIWLPTGDIDDDGHEIEVKLSIEWCKDTKSTSFVIGTHKNMLNKGEWQSDPQPKLPKSYKCYKMLYRIMFQYKTFKWCGEYLLDNETKDVCWFIYPYSGEIKDNIIVFSDVIKPSRYYQRDIYNPSIKNKTICELLSTFKEHMIFYSDDLCGTEFKQAIDFEIRK